MLAYTIRSSPRKRGPGRSRQHRQFLLDSRFRGNERKTVYRVSLLRDRSGSRAGSPRDPHADALQPRQDFVAKLRYFGEIIHKRQADPAHAGFADDGQFFGDPIGRADERIAADSIGGEIAALVLVDDRDDQANGTPARNTRLWFLRTGAAGQD